MLQLPGTLQGIRSCTCPKLMWTLKKGKKAIASKSSITAPNRKVLLLLKEFSDKKILYNYAHHCKCYNEFIDFYQLNSRQVPVDLMQRLVTNSGLFVMQTEFSVYVLLRLWIYLIFHPNWDGSPQDAVMSSHKFFQVNKRLKK